MPSRPCASGRAAMAGDPHSPKLMTRLLTFFAATALFAGCAAVPPPPLTQAHPASPDAPEGARLARQTSLRADEATRKSHTLLAGAEKEQAHWEAHGPVSGTPEDAPKTDAKMDMKKMEMKHDH